MLSSLTVGEVAARIRENYANDPQGRRLSALALAGYMKDTLTTMTMKTARAFFGVPQEAIRNFLSADLVLEDGTSFANIGIPISEEFGTAFIAQVRERGENVNTGGAEGTESDRQSNRDLPRGS